MSCLPMTNSKCGVQYLTVGEIQILQRCGVGILGQRIAWHRNITSGTQENYSPASLRCPILASLQEPELNLVP